MLSISDLCKKFGFTSATVVWLVSKLKNIWEYRASRPEIVLKAARRKNFYGCLRRECLLILTEWAHWMITIDLCSELNLYYSVNFYIIPSMFTLFLQYLYNSIISDIIRPKFILFIKFLYSSFFSYIIQATYNL